MSTNDDPWRSIVAAAIQETGSNDLRLGRKPCVTVKRTLPPRRNDQGDRKDC